MADIKALEHSTLKVPYELLNKRFRATQKAVDRESSYLTTVANDFSVKIRDCNDKIMVKEADDMLDNVVQRLQTLKRKADDGLEQELQLVDTCRKRLEHLSEYATEGRLAMPAVQAWKRKRMDRMLVDHCLRSGFYDTAVQLAKDANIEQLVDIEVFMVSRRVEDCLSNKDTAPCLSWCYENKSKLRKLKSTLEFNVRVQDFIELVRDGKRVDAVKYAQKHLSSAEPHLLGEVQSAMCLLAFSPQTECLRYKKLFDPKRWDDLVTQFRQDNFALHQLNGQSIMSVTLQAGLSALKTPQCYQKAQQNIDCPVCTQPLNCLATPLPFAHCTQSRLVCCASGSRMNEHNPPMVLPNGYVYGHNALVAMAESNNGRITCPRTKEQYKLRDAEKVYIM